MDSGIELSCESPDCIMGTVVVAKDSRTYVSVRPQSHGTAKGCGNGGHGIWTFAPIYARGYGTMTVSMACGVCGRGHAARTANAVLGLRRVFHLLLPAVTLDVQASYGLVSITLSCQPVHRQPISHKEGKDYAVVGCP